MTEKAMTETAMALLGKGLLADAIARTVAGGGQPYRADPADLYAIPDDCRAVITSDDGWDMDRYPQVRKVCADRELPWLPVRTELGRVVIGPIELPGRPGCVECAELRRRLARRDPQGYDAVWKRHSEVLRRRP